ncbi:MAG TPA: hypothetical protein VMQ99_20720 [Acetobacteraceae bacterium]|nr:hypothetical protein [Acetobacteraceae bacterium]
MTLLDIAEIGGRHLAIRQLRGDLQRATKRFDIAAQVAGATGRRHSLAQGGKGSVAGHGILPDLPQVLFGKSVRHWDHAFAEPPVTGLVATSQQDGATTRGERVENPHRLIAARYP